MTTISLILSRVSFEEADCIFGDVSFWLEEPWQG